MWHNDCFADMNVGIQWLFTVSLSNVYTMLAASFVSKLYTVLLQSPPSKHSILLALGIMPCQQPFSCSAQQSDRILLSSVSNPLCKAPWEALHVSLLLIIIILYTLCLCLKIYIYLKHGSTCLYRHFKSSLCDPVTMTVIYQC